MIHRATWAALALLILVGLGFVLSGCVPSLVPDERARICSGPVSPVADDDPALPLFEDAEPDDLEARKVALAVERANSCD